MQIIDSPLLVGSRLKDCAVVILENLKPRGEVRCVVFANHGRQFEVGTEEGSALFGDKFLVGIAFVASSLASEVPFES